MNFTVQTPNTADELISLIAQNQDTKYRFGAGYTDLLLELKKQPDPDLTVVNLARLQDDVFTSISEDGKGMRIGALITAAEIASDKQIGGKYPVLSSAAYQLASPQIRRVATIGGNVCTASPAGDMACALVALKAECEILSGGGSVRTLPIDRFFTGVRTTALKKNEILRSFLLPAQDSPQTLFSKYIKVGARKSMECSVVSLACHLLLDASLKITQAGVAIGSAAPTIKFAEAACDFLAGKKAPDIDSGTAEEFARKVLDYACPISDVRGSAWYRKATLFNICRGVIEELGK